MGKLEKNIAEKGKRDICRLQRKSKTYTFYYGQYGGFRDFSSEVAGTTVY